MADLEVLLGLTDRLARGRVADLGEVLEVSVGVTGLAFGDRTEQRGGIGVALDVGLLGEPQVTAVGLALAGEGFLQVLVGLGAVAGSWRCSLWWGVRLWVGRSRVRSPAIAAQAAAPWRCSAGTDRGRRCRTSRSGSRRGRRLPRSAVPRHVRRRQPSPHERHTDVVVVVDVRVEPGRADAEINRLQLAHRGEVGERLVHGAQRDARHLFGWPWRTAPRPWDARRCRGAVGTAAGAAA